MNIFSLNIRRLPEVFEVYFLRWRHSTHVELENLSDEELEIAPQTTHVGLLGNPKTAPYYDYLLGAATAAASSLGIELIPSRIENDTSDIERVIKIIADVPYGSMVVVPDSTTNNNHDLIIAVVARNRLPAVYPYRFFATAGRPHVIRHCECRPVPGWRGLRRSNPPRSQARQSAGTDTHEVPNSHQCKNREKSRLDLARRSPRGGR